MTSNLDTTFNTPNGYITTDFGYLTQKSVGKSIVIQPDGKIVMAGNTDDTTGMITAVSRYKTDGTLDPSFGTGGLASVSIPPGNCLIYSVALQQDGRIVVCGDISLGGFEAIVVIRFSSSGLIDPTFATFGYFIITSSMFNTSYPGLTFDRTFAQSVQIDTTVSPNKIVVAGSARKILPIPTRSYFAVARLDLTGSLDITFGLGGLVAYNFNTLKDEFCNSLAITSSGDYILGGCQQLAFKNNFAIVKLDNSGSPILGFGSSGIVSISSFFTGSDDYGKSLKIQQDGKFLLAGTSTKISSDSCYAIIRVDQTNGNLDNSFGTSGKVITDLSSLTPNINLTGNSLALQLDGKIVLGGTYSIPLTSVTSFSLARYDVNGNLDTTFGLAGTGLILEDIVTGTMQELGESVAIQSDGKILLGGTIGEFSDISETSYFILARYFGFPPNPPPPIPVNPICFPAGTPVLTDQGKIPIEQIDPAINTISSRPIVAITQTISNEDKIVCVEKHAFGINVPNRKTYISSYHGIMYKNRLIPARQFVGRFRGVNYVKYDGEKLYNVLMENHQIMIVNNMKVETLNPKNIIAKLYTSDLNNNEKLKIILEMNEKAKNKNHNYETRNGYENIVKNYTRRRFNVLRYNPIISRISFHTRKNYIQQLNQYNHTIRHRNQFKTFRPTIKLNPYTFRHGRRRR